MSSSPGEKRLGSIGAILARVLPKTGRGASPRSRGARRLRLEGLEDRKLLSVTQPTLPESSMDDAAVAASTIEPSDLVAPAENGAPTAVDDAFSMKADQQLGAGVLANDVDPEGDPLSVTLQSDVAHGTLNLGADGLFTYTPDDGFAGTDQFTYTAGDGQAESDPATVTITIGAVNDPPQAEADGYATEANQTLVVDAKSGVLANDTDAQGDPLTASLVDGAAHGTVTLAEDGSFEYTPDADFRGEDSFTYRASDGESSSDPATVTIAVGPTQLAPEAADDAYAAQEDEPLSIDAESGVLANDADADGDPLAAVLRSAPGHGTLTLGHDGSFEYTPNPDFFGEDSFTYVAGDGQAESNLATVSITVAGVNDAPVAADDAYEVNEDETLAVEASGVLANDADVEGDPLAAVLVDGPANGTVTLAEDGSFEYTPNPDFFGEDSFTYKASDGQAESNLAIVNITVAAAPDAPVAANDAYEVNEDETLAVEASGVLANDADADGDPLTAVLVDGPTNGTVTLAEDGSFEYTPNPDFFGDDAFTYRAGDGQAESNLATVSITVATVNDAPVAADDAYEVNEGETLAVEASGVLANDADVEGDPLTASLVDGPAHGTVTLAEDGSFEYTPEPGFHGEDRFTYTAGDGQETSETATVAIDVRRLDLEIALEVSATAFGPDVGSTFAGSVFWVNAYVKDLSDAPQGVVGGAVDVLYDGLWVNPTGSVVYGEDFSAFQQGAPDESAGLIDEAGALTPGSGVGVDGFAPFTAWQFTLAEAASLAEGDAHVQFAVEPGQGTATIAPANFALVGSGEPVDWALAELGTAELDLTLPDFNGDRLVNHFDLALWQTHSGSASGDPGYDPLYDLDNDGQIGTSDVDVLMGSLYRTPTAPPAVAETLSVAESPGDDQLADDPLADPWKSPSRDRRELAHQRRHEAHDELFARWS